MKLNETYNFNIKPITKKDGTTANFVYIDSKNSTDSTLPIKDDLKKFGASWDGFNKVWGWYLSSDPQKLQTQLKSFVYPAVEFLNSKETPPETGARSVEDMKAQINNLLGQIDNVIASPITIVEDNKPLMDEKSLKEKLKVFKEELINTMSSQDFLEKLEPIIKFRNAQGHQLSFLNSLLIWIQDPQARLVKSRGTWMSTYKREVLPDAPSLAVSTPDTKRSTISHYATKEEKAAYLAEFLKSVGKHSKDELTPGEKDKLRVGLMGLTKYSYTAFKYVYCYYDVRYTKQIDGTEDTVGSFEGAKDIEWSDETSEPTELTTKIYDSMLQIIQESGIRLSFVDDLGGAKGVSKSGAIDVLKDTPKNAGAASTLIHEFSHELLHQTYLSRAKEGNGRNQWADFFIGTQQGRHVVEQQAEMSAYLVMRFFGIKMQANINYMGIWGADAQKAASVFDTVASVANRIAEKIAVKIGMKQLNEGQEGQMITGMDVAELLGQEGVNMYNMSKQQEINRISENFQRFYNRINNVKF